MRPRYSQEKILKCWHLINVTLKTKSKTLIFNIMMIKTSQLQNIGYKKSICYVWDLDKYDW